MKPSLEDERRALLEQIEASRAVYRRMLADEPDRHADRAASMRDRGVSWMLSHPLWVAGGVALLVLVAPRIVARRRRRAAMRQTAPMTMQAAPMSTAQGGTLRALLTVGALLLRDPQRMRTAARFAASAWQWLQRRQQARASASLPRSPSATAPARTGARPHRTSSPPAT